MFSIYFYITIITHRQLDQGFFDLELCIFVGKESRKEGKVEAAAVYTLPPLLSNRLDKELTSRCLVQLIDADGLVHVCVCARVCDELPVSCILDRTLCHFPLICV